jgi:hypothetical protein
MARASAARSPSSVASFVTQVKEAETAATETHEVLASILAKSEDLISRQRESLLEVARLSSELAEIEKRRSVLKAALASKKAKLLIGAAETSEVIQSFEQAVESGGQSSVASSSAGTVALQAIEKIQAAVFGLTEKALRNDNLQADSDDANALISTVNDVIEEAIKSGGIIEAPADTVRRQSYVISALLPQSEE